MLFASYASHALVMTVFCIVGPKIVCRLVVAEDIVLCSSIKFVDVPRLARSMVVF